MTGKNYTSVLIFSPLWSVLSALQTLCQPGRERKKGTCNERITVVCHRHEILSGIANSRPDVLVLDISLRASSELLNTIRYFCPDLPVIIVQPRFLFSDRVVAEYFGLVWLKEYDAILAGYPAFGLAEHLTHEAFAGAECGGSSQCHVITTNKTEMSDLYTQLALRLRLRLYDLFRSPRLCDVVMNWLVTGTTPTETGRLLSRSRKLIYHYRGRVMRALNIYNCSRDFIPSLTVETGFREEG